MWVASTCYLVFKVAANLTYLVAIIDGHVKPGYHLLSDVWPNTIPYNAFDHMELCFVL